MCLFTRGVARPSRPSICCSAAMAKETCLVLLLAAASTWTVCAGEERADRAVVKLPDCQRCKVWSRACTLLRSPLCILCTVRTCECAVDASRQCVVSDHELCTTDCCFTGHIGRPCCLVLTSSGLPRHATHATHAHPSHPLCTPVYIGACERLHC